MSISKGRSKRSVLKLETKPKNKSQYETRRFTPYDWSNPERKAQETGWAPFRFYVMFYRFCVSSKPKSKKPKNEQPKQAQARTDTMAATTATVAPSPRQVDDREKKNTNNMSLMPVNAASITSVEPVAHGAVPRRIEVPVHSKIVCCCSK